MSSDHNADPSVFNDPIVMMTGVDRPTAQAFRVPLEKLADNCAYLKAQHDTATLSGRLRRSVQLRTLQRAGDTIDDTTDSLAAIQLGKLSLLLKANSGGIAVVSGGVDRYGLLGALASVTSLIHGVASYSGALVAIGSGGNGNCSSGDNGLTWSAGGGGAVATVAAAARARIVADPDSSRFVVAGPGSTNAYTSIDGAAWAAHAMGVTTGSAGLAAVPFSVYALSEGANTLRYSGDGGATWSAVTGFPANSGTFDESGCIVGDYPNSKLWHVARKSSGASLQVSSGTRVTSTVTWTTRATITAASVGLASFGERPRIFCCPTTGLLVIVGRANGTTLSYAMASLDGVTWGTPMMLPIGADFTVDAFAVAGGRLFATTDAQLFASDGVAL